MDAISMDTHRIIVEFYILMEHLISLISTYGIYILFPVMIIEGPIITITVSFLVSTGILHISVVVIYIFAVLGNLISDVVYYVIGRVGRERFIKKYGGYIGLHEERIRYIESHYKEHLLKTVLVAKITEAAIVPALVAAGIAKADFYKFVTLSLAIELVKVFVFIFIGYNFGKLYVMIGLSLKDAMWAYGITICIFAILFVMYKKLKAKET
jgi:membrane protein DedA with SNARE-associated domain